MTHTYQFAGLNIRIASLHDAAHRLCADYRVTDGGPVDFEVRVTQADIDFEREKSRADDARAGRPARPLTDEYLETLAVCRRIAEKLPDHDALLCHGSCVAVDGEGFLFMASSGVGKSTHARLWRELFGERAVMINDDKPIIRLWADGPIAYGTPWDGKHRLSANTSAPLRAVCLLARAEENAIRPLSVDEAYPALVRQVYRPAERRALAKTLTLIDRLAASAGLWRLDCNMSLDAARTACRAMRGSGS